MKHFGTTMHAAAVNTHYKLLIIYRVLRRACR